MADDPLPPARAPSADAHYDQSYFDWQRAAGEFGGWANLPKFEAVVRATDTVLDFGCGGGYLLRNLRCARRLGVEINAAARRTALDNGVEAYATCAELPDECADVVVSDNALEHTTHPLEVLEALHAKLKPGGTLCLVVPCETIGWRYRPGDVNRHLYSWGPMCLGNLLTEAGFRVIESRPYVHKWPPKAALIARLFGRAGFELAARACGHLRRDWFQVRSVAIKPRPPGL